jgi:AcrR family transcriptional regulator
MVGAEATTATPSGGTRELLLDTAERLLAERGINGVSLREIGLAANQRNNGAIQYHFGDKAGLVRAVFERRAAAVNDRRLQLLRDAAQQGTESVTDLVRAFVEPLGEQVQQGNWYVPFLSRLQAEHQRDELLQPVRNDVNTAFDRVRRQLRRDHFASMPREIFVNRLRLAVNLAIDALADDQVRRARGDEPTLAKRLVVDDLVAVISGLLTAPRSRPEPL